MDISDISTSNADPVPFSHSHATAPSVHACPLMDCLALIFDFGTAVGYYQLFLQQYVLVYRTLSNG